MSDAKSVMQGINKYIELIMKDDPRQTDILVLMGQKQQQVPEQKLIEAAGKMFLATALPKTLASKI